MPGYGLPDDRKGLLPWSWAEVRLKRSHNYWITTVRPDGSPHTMIVWGLWLNRVFYFSTGRQSRKARNLRENSKCVVCTEESAEAVILEGEAGLVADSSLLRTFFSRYEKKYSWDMSEMQEEPVFAVSPAVVFGLFEKSFMKSATCWRFVRAKSGK
jgi:uncharacterized pyridoxamine 5'-phosphate oxidase family protein